MAKSKKCNRALRDFVLGFSSEPMLSEQMHLVQPETAKNHEVGMLIVFITLFLGLLIDETHCWWSSRRRRRRCTSSDCTLGQWSPWGVCSQTCGQGMQERQRPILKKQTCGAKQGSVATDFAQSIEYHPGGNWGACRSDGCSVGLRWRNLTVIRNGCCGGRSCISNRTESEMCIW